MQMFNWKPNRILCKSQAHTNFNEKQIYADQRLLNSRIMQKQIRE